MSSKSYPFHPDWSVHPGEMLKDYMECLHLTLGDVERYSGIHCDTIMAILQLRAGITPKVATGLAKIDRFPSAGFWMNLQKLHDYFEQRTADGQH